MPRRSCSGSRADFTTHATRSANADGNACGWRRCADDDVLRDEPPATDHAAWNEPNLLLTPHVGRSRERPPFRWEPLFVENLRRFAADEPLLNVVDVAAGY